MTRENYLGGGEGKRLFFGLDFVSAAREGGGDKKLTEFVTFEGANRMTLGVADFNNGVFKNIAVLV